MKTIKGPPNRVRRTKRPGKIVPLRCDKEQVESAFRSMAASELANMFWALLQEDGNGPVLRTFLREAWTAMSMAQYGQGQDPLVAMLGVYSRVNEMVKRARGSVVSAKKPRGKLRVVTNASKRSKKGSKKP